MENINNSFEKIKSESLKVSREIKNKTFGFIITAFGLVAGLAWNEAIQSLIKSLFPVDKESVWIKFIYAILMTLILVLITIGLAKIFGKDEAEEKK